MQMQSDSGNVKATRTQERNARIIPQPFIPFDPFSATIRHNTLLLPDSLVSS